MAEGLHEKVKVKNLNIRQIFDKMDYGEALENTNLSKTWLKNIYSYIEKKDEGSKGEATEIKDVNNGESLTTVYSPKPEDVEQIILSSVKNDKWSVKESTERAILLERLAREIERHSTLFCQLEVSARGILSTDTKTKALPLLTEYLQYYESWAVKYKNEKENRKGIAVTIISEESFLAVFSLVLGPALAAGYNVILQTEPRISLVASLIIELAENVGVPEGVIKLLPGNVELDSLFKHKDIAIISSFGNLHAKKYKNIEKPLKMKFLAVTNSKIPMIVFNNGDLDSACDSVIDAVWGYQGLLPWSVNTLIVQEDIFQTFVDKLKNRLSKVKMGFATDKLADISYPITADAKRRLNQAVKEAKLQGIEVFQPNQNSEAFQPTLLIGGKLFYNNVILEDNNLPVLTVIAFRTSNEAVSLANNTRYGFAASIWTENIGLANEVAGKLNVANVWINCHGNFSATTSFTPQKQSGTGYFGGPDGFFEYININSDKFKCNDIFSYVENPNLPQKLEDSLFQSFYGGSFKKSESGLIDGVYDQPIGKDLHNAIAAAKKGQEAWSKLTISSRSQMLKKVADEIYHKKKYLGENILQSNDTNLLDKWTAAIYKGAAELDSLGSVSVQKCYEFRSYREPIGILAIDCFLEPVETIVGALLLGNSVIVLDSKGGYKYSQFAMEMCKILLTCNIPPGVFNVILNCNKDVLNAIVVHKELNVYFARSFNTSLNKTNIRDLKRFCLISEDWKDVIANTTKIKNVWSNIGDSVL